MGVIGIGRMGKGIAATYLRAGLSVAVFDVDSAPVQELAALGAEVADSPLDVARNCPIVTVVVRDGPQLAAAAYGPLGLLQGLEPGSTIILHTTVLPVDLHPFADEVTARGARVLEATMTGGVQGAASGGLTLMVGGDPELLDECWSFLRHIARKRIHIGPLGTSGVCKAIQDTLYAVHHQATHEALELAVKAGVSPDRFFEVMHAKGWVVEKWDQHWTSDGTEEKLPAPGGSVRHAPQSLGPLVWAMAEELGVDMEICERAIARSIAIADEKWPEGR